MPLTIESDTLALVNAIKTDLDTGLASGIADPTGTIQFPPARGYSDLSSTVRTNASTAAAGSFTMLFHRLRNYDPLRVQVTTFLNGFTAWGDTGYSDGYVRYYKNAVGEGVLEGLIRVPASWVTGTLNMFTLNADYRPQSAHVGIGATYDRTGVQVHIAANGVVSLSGPASLAGYWVSLDGIRWQISNSPPIYTTTGGGGTGSSITLTGAITGSGTGTVTTSIANGAVTLANLADMTTGLIGRSTPGVGAPEVITVGSGLTLSGGVLASVAGGGSVTTVSVVHANGFTGSVANPGSTPAITLSLDDGGVALVKLPTQATNTLLGRSTAGTGAVEVITVGSGLSLSGGYLTAIGDGTGTVTSVSVTTANGVSGSVATATTTPAITLTLGAITPSSVASTGAVTGTNLSGTNTGDQTITLTGDVTGSGTGSFATTIANSAVSLAKMANMATASLLGRSTAGAGAPEVISIGSGLTLAAGTLSASGGGTVTDVSVVTANGVSGSVATSTTTPAITLTLGAITPSSVSTGSVFNTNGSGATDVAVKIGTSLADGSLHASAKLLSVRSGITGTEVEKMWVTSDGSIRQAYGGKYYGAAASSGGLGFLSIDDVSGTRLQYTSSVWIAMDAANIVIASPNMNVWSQYRTLAFYSGAGYLVDDQGTSSAHYAWKLGTSVATASVNASAKLFSVQTNISSGVGDEWFNVTKTGITATGTVTGSNLSGTNTGDQTITLTGDVTGSGTGSFAATIANSAVSLAKMANMATASLLGRSTAGAGAPEVISVCSGLTLAAGTLTATGTGGTVTDVSVVTANGVSGSVATSTTTPAITLTLGAITPSSVSTGSVFNTNGSGSTDVAVKIGTSLADGSLHASAKLLSVRSGITGTEVEKMWVTSDGSIRHAYGGKFYGASAAGYLSVDDVVGTRLQNGSGIYILMDTNLAIVSSSLSLSSQYRTFTVTGGPAYCINDQGTSSAHYSWKLGTSVATASVDAAAKLFSVQTNISSGTGDEWFNVTKTGITATGTVTGSNLSGTNTGDQTITLTGDVTGSGTGSFAATIANSAVSLAKMANMATASLLGRSTAGTGAPEVITVGSGLTLAAGTLTATGTGSVTSVSVVTANGISGSVATATTTPAITLTLGDITPSSISNSNGGSSGDIVVKVGSSLADASVHAAAHLFSVRTGVTGTEVEKLWVDKSGSIHSAVGSYYQGASASAGYLVVDDVTGSKLAYGAASLEMNGNINLSTTNFSLRADYRQLAVGGGALNLYSDQGTGSGHSAVAVGSSVADASVNLAAKLFSVRTDIDATPTEYFNVTKGGVNTPVAVTIAKPPVNNEPALFMPTPANSATYGNAGCIMWGGPGDLDYIRVTSDAGMAITAYSKPVSIGPAYSTLTAGCYLNDMSHSTDWAVEIGSSSTDALTHANSTLASFYTGGTGAGHVTKVAVKGDGAIQLAATTPSSSLSAAGDVKLRNRYGALQVSTDGGAYYSISPIGATTTLYVNASTGADTNPGTSGSPYQTVKAALAALSVCDIRNTVTLSLTGTVAGFSVAGLQGGGIVSSSARGRLVIDGGTTLFAGIATGVNTGTAGSGTTSTSMVKPTAAANWTASDLRGYLLKITSGGGSGEQRPILANTTTALTVHSIAGMDNTSVFEICSPATTVTADTDALLGASVDYCVLASDNDLAVTFKNIKFSGSGLENLIYSDGNRDITVDACFFDVATNADSFYSRYDGRVTIKNSVIKSTCNAQVYDCGKEVLVSGMHLNNGRVRLDRCQSANVQIDAISCAANAFYAAMVNYLRLDINANSCTATPVYMESVSFFEPTGTYGLSGASNTGATTYGVEINKAGRYNLVGGTITGSGGDIKLDGVVQTWATLSSGTYGVAMSYGTTLIATTGQNQAIVQGNYSYTGNMTIGGRTLLYGYLNQSSTTGGLTATGTNQGTALALSSYSFAEITSVPSGTGVVLPSNAAIAGVECTILNSGSYELTIYPSGSGTVDGLSSVKLQPGCSRRFFSRNTASGTSWWSTGKDQRDSGVWRDITTDVESRAVGTGRPTLAAFRAGNVVAPFFSANDWVPITFHIPHDYVRGSDLYLHVHWAHNGEAISGSLVLDFSVTYAKGHNQANFPAEISPQISVSTPDITTIPQYRHRIEEIQLSAASPSASQLDSDDIEVDGLVMVYMKSTTIPTITGASTPEPAIMFVDLHYLSNGHGTVNKAPNFYGA